MAMRTVSPKLGWIMLGEAAAFATGSLSHIPVKLGPISEPRIIPATIVEGLCAAALAAAGVSVLRRTQKQWESAFGAQLLSACGVLLGMAALAAGRGPRTQLNDAFHSVILVALVAGLSALWWQRESKPMGSA